MRIVHFGESGTFKTMREDLRESIHLISTPKRCRLAETYLRGTLRMVRGLKSVNALLSA